MFLTSGMQNKWLYLLRRAIMVARDMVKINLPIHVLPFLVFKKWNVNSVVKLLKNIVGSTAFLTCYAIS